MNTNLKPIVLLTAAGILLWYYSRGMAAKKLNVNFQNIKFEKPRGIAFPELLVNFKIENPTNTPLQIDSLVGDIFVNDKLLSSINQNNPVTILNTRTTVYTVRATLKKGIVDAVYSILQLITQKKPINVRFKGWVKSSGLNIPIDTTVIQL